MPYIPQDRRADVLAEMREHGTHWTPKNAGDLNFAVTCFIDNFIFENGCRYANLNEMIGALECCKLELYRRLAAPYEDQVLEANGDAYVVAKGRRNTNGFCSTLNGLCRASFKEADYIGGGLAFWLPLLEY